MSTQREREAARDAAAFDQICQSRPLKPPPLPMRNDTRTAGAIELANEIRAGHFEPCGESWHLT
jgi:hypothetical protein